MRTMRSISHAMLILCLLCVGCMNVTYRPIRLDCYTTSGQKIPPKDISVFVFTRRTKKVWWESGVPHRLTLLRPTNEGFVDNIPQGIRGDGISLSPVVLVFANGTYPVNISYVTTFLNERDCQEEFFLGDSDMKRINNSSNTFIPALKVTVCLPKIREGIACEEARSVLGNEYILDSDNNPFFKSNALVLRRLNEVDTSSLPNSTAKETWEKVCSLPVLDGIMLQYLKNHFSIEAKEAIKLLIALNRVIISEKAGYAKKHFVVED